MSGAGLELHDAASTGDYDALEEYIRTGKYDLNLKDIDAGNRTALHWACQKGQSATWSVQGAPKPCCFVTSVSADNDDDDDDDDSNNNNSNNNNDNHIQRRNSRFFTISSLRREPTRTRKWPGRNRVQFTCNKSSVYHVQHVVLVPRGTKGQLS